MCLTKMAEFVKTGKIGKIGITNCFSCQVANTSLAWLLTKVTSTVAVTAKISHIQCDVKSVDIRLQEILNRCELRTKNKKICYR